MGTKLTAEEFDSYVAETPAKLKLSSEDFDRYTGRDLPQEQPSFLNELKLSAKARVGEAASLTATAADMLLGAPGRLMESGHKLLGYGVGRAEGLPTEEAWRLSEEAPLVPQWMQAPATTALEAAGGKGWNTEGLDVAMEKGIEAGAESVGASPGGAKWGVGVAMDLGGMAGLGAAGRAMRGKSTQGWENVSPEARAVEEQARAQETAGTRKASVAATAAAEAANPPFRQQMPEPLTKAERSARTAESAKRVKEAFKKDPETADYWKYLEDERLQENYRPLVDQAMKEGRRYEKPAYDELMLRAKDAIAKPGFLQTAQDKLVLKEALRERAIDFAKMGKFGEMGKIDPQLQKILAGVAIGTAVAAAAVPSLWEFLDEHVKPTVNRWKHSDEREQFFQDRVKELERKAGESLSPEAVEQLREDFIQKRWNPQAPAGERKNWTLNEALVGGGLLASTALGPKSAMGVVRESVPYGSKVLERLGHNKVDFGKQEVQQVLNQADVAKADREVFSEILKEHPGERIPADALVKEFQLKTGSHTLEPVETSKFTTEDPDYGEYIHGGFERIGRSTNTDTTTLWRLPEHMEMTDANHFQDSRLFGHTRSFVEDGVKHVVELQSDLMQHAKALTPEKRAELLEDTAHLRAHLDNLGAILEGTEKLPQRLESFLKKTLSKNDDQLMLLEDAIAIREHVDLVGIKTGDYLTSLIHKLEKDSDPFLVSTIRESVYSRKSKLLEIYEDNTIALNAASADSQLSPFIKHWPRRLIREELAAEAKNPSVRRQWQKAKDALQKARDEGIDFNQSLEDFSNAEETAFTKVVQAEGKSSVVRFATADTVAKVEGWPLNPSRDLQTWGQFIEERRAYAKNLGFSDNTDFVKETEAWAKKHAPSAPYLKEKEHQSIYDRYAGEITTYLKSLGGKEVTDAQGVSWIEVPVPKKGPVNMYGKADPQLLMTIGGAATGAVLGSLSSDDPLFGGITGSLIGAALSLPKGRAVIGDVAKGADYLGGMISTRILHKAPALYKVMHDLDRGELTRAGNYMSRVVPWLTESVNLSKEQKTLLNTGIFMKDMKTLADVNEGNPKLVAGWREVQNLLRETGEQAKGLGRFKELNADYFPQRVKDYKGLMGHLGSEVKTRLETLIKEAETRATKQNRVFTDTERDALINAELRKTYKPSSYLPSYAKDRKIQQVTEDLQKFYYTPQQALVISLGEVARDLELAKTFGKDLMQSKHEGKSYINVDLSVGNVVGRLMKKGKLDAEAQLELEGLLKSRLGPGERSPYHLLTDVQALGYMATLNDVVATAVQLGDPLKVAYTQGPRATMTAIARKLSGRSHITAEEFHLSDHIAQELAAGSVSSVPLKRAQRAAVGTGAGVGALLGWEKQDDLWGAGLGALAGSYITLVGVAGASGALNKLMRHQAFAKLDLAGKGIALEAALIRHQRLAQSPAGIKDITRRYGEIYGDQLPQLLDDLKQRKITEPVRSLAWMELSREQPISKLERSQAFLNNPNARGLWMLKNWMAKQLDLVRRDVYDEMKKGDKESVARGLRNLTALSFVFGLAGMPGNAIKNWILGRDVDFEAGDILENTLKTFGWSEYTRQKMKEGHPVDTFLGTFAPPWQIMDRIIEQDPKAVMHIPLAGRIYEARELGGNERYEISQREMLRKRLQDERGGRKLTADEKRVLLPPLSPAAKLYRQQLKEQQNGTR